MCIDLAREEKLRGSSMPVLGSPSYGKYAKTYFGNITIILKHIDGGLYHFFPGFHGAIGTGYYFKLQLLECLDNQ